MSEFRKEPNTGGWVIIATDRGKRPSDFGSVKDQRKGGPCFFCAGHEAETPPETLAVRPGGSAPDSKGWSVRAVPNKFSALDSSVEFSRQGHGMFDIMTGHGFHDVVIETPDHNAHICDLAVEHLADVIKVYRECTKRMLDDPTIRYVEVFKNWGAAAGASLEHTHSQIIGLPVTPRRIKETLQQSMLYYQIKDRCIFCDIISQEREEGVRVVGECKDFIAIMPFASRFPFQIAIYPTCHNSCFWEITDSLALSLAGLLKSVLFALRVALIDPPFNYFIHTRPRKYEREGYWTTIDDDFHWHLEILPRLTKTAGFEFGTGFYINPTPPEQAADFLREVMLPCELIRDDEHECGLEKPGNK